MPAVGAGGGAGVGGGGDGAGDDRGGLTKHIIIQHAGGRREHIVIQEVVIQCALFFSLQGIFYDKLLFTQFFIG